jgi:hypothetical protein
MSAKLGVFLIICSLTRVRRAKEIVRGAKSTFSIRALGVIGPSVVRLPSTIKALFGSSIVILAHNPITDYHSLNIRGSFKA